MHIVPMHILCLRLNIFPDSLYCALCSNPIESLIYHMVRRAAEIR